MTENVLAFVLNENGTMQLVFPDGAELYLEHDEAMEFSHKLIAVAKCGTGSITIVKGDVHYTIHVGAMH